LQFCVAACSPKTSPPTEEPATAPTADPCVPLPNEGDACPESAGFCVESWGEPGGFSTALWCRDGKWQREEEVNLP
jgi:hypothetical protein